MGIQHAKQLTAGRNSTPISLFRVLHNIDGGSWSVGLAWPVMAVCYLLDTFSHRPRSIIYRNGRSRANACMLLMRRRPGDIYEWMHASRGERCRIIMSVAAAWSCRSLSAGEMRGGYLTLRRQQERNSGAVELRRHDPCRFWQ